MPSITTLYRAIVMIAAGVIVVKGWQLYGPTTEQVKSFGVGALEKAQLTWNNLQPTATEPTAAAADPRLAAPPVPAAVAPSLVESAPLFSAATTVEPAGAETVDAASVSNEVADRLPQLYSRLESLGVSHPQLAPWGSSGQMYRFCCRASLSDSPALARHFEAVASQPVSAVEQVVAKVEAWRAIQRDTSLR